MLLRKHIVACSAVLLVALAPAPVRAQEEAALLERSYSSLVIASELPESVSWMQELSLAIGRFYPRGRDGVWSAQGELALGLVTGSRFVDGAFAGARLVLGRAVPLPFIELPSSHRTDLMILAGGAAYGGYDLPEALDRVAFVPALVFGAGLRMRPVSAAAPGALRFSTLEIVREERFRGFEPRTYLRIGVATPRATGGQRNDR